MATLGAGTEPKTASHVPHLPLPFSVQVPFNDVTPLPAASGHAQGCSSRSLILLVYLVVLLGQVGPQLKRGHEPFPAVLARVGELLRVHLDHVFLHAPRVAGPVLA